MFPLRSQREVYSNKQSSVLPSFIRQITVSQTIPEPDMKDRLPGRHSNQSDLSLWNMVMRWSNETAETNAAAFHLQIEWKETTETTQKNLDQLHRKQNYNIFKVYICRKGYIQFTNWSSSLNKLIVSLSLESDSAEHPFINTLKAENKWIVFNPKEKVPTLTPANHNCSFDTKSVKW